MGSTSGSLQRQIMQALEYLNLITDTGTPTEKLEQLVHSEGPKKQEILKEILKSSYSFLFRDGIQLDRATASQFRERFEKTGATGDTLRKCMAFFLTTARTADIGLSPHIKKVPSTKTGPAKPKRITQPKHTGPAPQRDLGTPIPQKAMPSMTTEDTSLAKLILDKMPDFNPEWTEETQKSWIDTISKLMDRLEKK